MNFFSADTRFWLKWLLLATIVFCASFAMSARDQHFSKQWARPDLPVYDPFRLHHFTIGIKPADYAFLFSDMPESLYAFQNAEVSVDRTPVSIKAKFRIRGTHSWNWDSRKPSFRLRQSGKRKILSRSNLNFSLADDPSMLANLVTDYIAAGQKIPSARTTICTVTINGDYKGLYHLSEPINPESMAWQDFPGAAVIEGNARESRMWTKPELWQIQINPNDNPDKPFKCLEKMLKLVTTPVQTGNLDNLEELVNIDRLASWSALMTAIGSIHTNDFFGNSFVYDARDKKLFPIITDPTGFGVLTTVAGVSDGTDIEMPPYEFLTPLLNAFFRVPEFQFKRNAALYQLLNHELQLENLEKLVEHFIKLLQPLFHKETYASALLNVPILGFPQKVPVSASAQINDSLRLLDFMKKRREFLLKLLITTEASISASHERTQVNGRWYKHLIIKISGHCPINWDFSAWRNRMMPDINFDHVLDTGIEEFYGPQLLFPGLFEDNTPGPHWLQLDQRGARFILKPDNQIYILGASEEHFAECLEFLQNQGKNALTGEKVSLSYNADPPGVENPVKGNPAVLHPWRKWVNDQN